MSYDFLLQRAVEKILIFAASKSYFISEEARDARFKRFALLYKDLMFEVYLLFYEAILPVFTTFNLLLQHDAILYTSKCRNGFLFQK